MNDAVTLKLHAVIAVCTVALCSTWQKSTAVFFKLFLTLRNFITENEIKFSEQHLPFSPVTHYFYYYTAINFELKML
jgi:hypothetical protein